MFTVKKFKHQKKEYWAIYIEKKHYNSEIKLSFNTLGCYFSWDERCWLVPVYKVTMDEIFNELVPFGFVDYSAIERKDLVKQTVDLPRSYRKDIVPELHKEAFKRYCEYLDARGFASNTKNNYQSMVKTFLSYHSDVELDSIGLDDINSFISHAVVGLNYSTNYHRQMVCALKSFYRNRYQKELDLDKIPYPRKQNALPKVLSTEEIGSIIGCLTNLKHRAMICLQYSCGLRVNELLNLQVSHLDLTTGVLIVLNAKGNKDRRLIVNGGALDEMRRYIQAYQPQHYMFVGQSGGPYSNSSINNVLKKAAKKVGINKQVTSHMLRHSFATHLLNAGVDLRIIQELLGHKSSRTTEIYTHVSTKMIESIPSLYDRLNLNSQKNNNQQTSD